jgi:pyruvate formate lyase activating enzyme
MKVSDFENFDFSFPLTRRKLIKGGIACAFLISPADILAKKLLSPEKNVKKIILNDAPENLWKWSKEVYFKEALQNSYVRCLTCPNKCILPPDGRSRCKSHVNKNGKLYTLVYGNPCAVHVDPVEKKPLFHFLPSTNAFSIATTGCSFHCLNCQNWEISQVKPEEVRFHDMFPDAVVKNAVTRNCRSIAYTYSEATTFYEYMLDTSRLARERNIKNIWVTNGYINREPLLELCKSMDGANIDIKSFSESLYSKLNAGRLKPVLNTLRILKENGVWFEMTALIVPTYADDMEMIKKMCHWIAENLGPDYPLHFSRFFPRYKLTHLPPTSISFLEDARKEAMKIGLHYVYVGNVPPSDSSHTYCPSCKKKIVHRIGYLITENKIGDGKCSFCGHPIAGVWN